MSQDQANENLSQLKTLRDNIARFGVGTEHILKAIDSAITQFEAYIKKRQGGFKSI